MSSTSIPWKTANGKIEAETDDGYYCMVWPHANNTSETWGWSVQVDGDANTRREGRSTCKSYALADAAHTLIEMRSERMNREAININPSAIARHMAQMKAYIERDLVLRWEELFKAMECGISTRWSIQCENLAKRIHEATALVGPVNWSELGLTQLIDGTYLEAIGRMKLRPQHYTYPSPEEEQKLREIQADLRRANERV